MNVEKAREIVCRDLSPEFLRTVAVDLAWEYSKLFEGLLACPSLSSDLRNEEFGKRRGLCAINSLTKAARLHGVPFEFRRLACNGQEKLLVKAGRLILLQEPILTLADNPRASDYKVELADAHGFIDQLELDLGDQPLRIRDWSGSILTVLLHGASGAMFTRDHKSLGGLMLAVPNETYSHWNLRIDLHQLAMHGRGLNNSMASDESIDQVDRVHVTIKNNNKKKGSGE